MIARWGQARIKLKKRMCFFQFEEMSLFMRSHNINWNKIIENGINYQFHQLLLHWRFIKTAVSSDEFSEMIDKYL